MSAQSGENAMPELFMRACPFCALSAQLAAYISEYWVYCPNCNARGPRQPTAALAIDAWNTRYTLVPEATCEKTQPNPEEPESQ